MPSALRRPWLAALPAALITFSLLAAEPPPNAWRQTSDLPAEEANQAAAADEHFVYAVTNASIGKYDRADGRRVAVSSGEAKHLNSGFFWQGRLYCAHSNFPKTPEQSQVKVLDTSTMCLETFHDFGAYGGSLTWVVRHDDHWWCNFARYGSDNARTFLVKFDDQWNERGRWTYPPELIAQLRKMSLSGGVWREERLLVTGHDEPQLYCLGLPREGTVMDYLGKQAVPFTGQGIADDPLTGGLVGIQRPKRCVVFAAPPARAAGHSAPVTCPGHYSGHLQGVCTGDGDVIYWSFTVALVKTDRQGQLIRQVPVPTHHGDLCFHDGKLYVAVNLGKFNLPAGAADSWVYVYDAESLELLARHAVPDVLHGAGGMACRAGRFYVVGGLPEGVEENYVYEYDAQFILRRRHVLASGYTLKGIQTAAFIDGQWWFGCYGSPKILLQADAALEHVRRYEFEAALGIAGTADGRILVARGGREQGQFTASLVEAVRDPRCGLAVPAAAAAPAAAEKR